MSGLGRTLADLELRNAAAMRAGQARYDNAAPDDDELPEDWLDEDSALQQAADELATTPASVMFHLGHLVEERAEPVPLSLLMSRDFDWLDHDAATLLIVALEGSAENSRMAILELRDRIANRALDDAKRRARELLDDQKRREQSARDEWALDRAREDEE